MILPQPHPGPAAILRDELDAGGFEGGLNGVAMSDGDDRLSLACFRSLNCGDLDLGSFRQFARLPIQQLTCFSDLRAL
jgi:hypothetical protein